MDDIDEDVPELVPVLDNADAHAVQNTGQGGPVVEAPERLDKTVPVTLITGFLGVLPTPQHCSHRYRAARPG